MSVDRTPDGLGIGAAPEVVAQSPAGVAGPARQAGDIVRAGARQAVEDMCQNADWLAVTERPAPAAPGRDRLRRWGREYGAYAAAGVLALGVLICGVTGLPGMGVTWHAGTAVPVDGSPSTAPTPSAAAQTAPAAAPSPAPSREPTRRPATAPGARTPARPPSVPPSAVVRAEREATPTARERLLGPSGSRALAGIVDDYCEQRFDRSAALLRPWPDSGAERNWSCQRRRREVIIADMTDACVVRYGTGVVARYLDAKDPFSWRCYR